ncbi:MAG: response regulator [Candidatus Omnitrophica bacterium]|nr:response regulator [Candidatus Omnitrophota bacterium]
MRNCFPANRETGPYLIVIMGFLVYNLIMPKKILIIDDDYNIAKENKEALLKAGYQVVTAYSGKEGVEKVKAEKPDCILLDLVLPDESGFKVAQDIKSLPEFIDTPIIATSLKHEEIDKHVAAKSGITVYVEKPIDYQRLLFDIKDVLIGGTS